MEIQLDLNSIESYCLFLKIKQLPRQRFVGRTAIVEDHYAKLLGLKAPRSEEVDYVPSEFLFDYQADIARMAIRKRKYATFVKMGYGKSLIQFEFARHAAKCLGKRRNVLITTPLMVVPQMAEEYQRFYKQEIPIIPARKLQDWIDNGRGIGLTNWEALKDDLTQGRLGAMIWDESGLLKSSYGKWGQVAIRLGKGLEWKLAASGTPAPNDRIEFANHAILLDRFPTYNSFLAKYFVNKGNTGERWELKPHAVEAFYRDMADWSIFMQNPATYGWKDNVGKIPPVHTHIHNVSLTPIQRELTLKTCGGFFAEVGGIASRGKLARLAKGSYNGQQVATNKPAFIRKLVDSWPDKSTIIWVKYNDEQDVMESTFPEFHSMRGETPHEKRQGMLADFRSGKVPGIIAKSKVMGLGLNLEKCERMVFNTCHDSAEEYLQCIGRGNRVGAVNPLHVHVPVTELERPMMETVLTKIVRIQHDEAEQERVFKSVGFDFLNAKVA